MPLLFHTTECDPPSNLTWHKDQLTLILFLCFPTLDVLSLISQRSHLKVVALTWRDLDTVYNKSCLQKQGGSERLDSIVIVIRLKFMHFTYLLELCSTFFLAAQSDVLSDLLLQHQRPMASITEELTSPVLIYHSIVPSMWLEIPGDCTVVDVSP